MDQKLNKKWIGIFIFSLVPVVMLALVYKQLPEQVPMHWGINGEVDRYGAKSEMWFLSCLAPLLAIMFYVLPKIDPRKTNYDKFKNAYEVMAVLIVAFMIGIQALVIAECLHPGRFSMSTVIMVAIGILLAITGNYMPKFKSNFFVGIKTPWTLSSPEVWNKTHRLAGPLWVGGGVLLAVAGLLPSDKAKFALMMVIVLIITVIPLTMSYVWYERGKKVER